MPKYLLTNEVIATELWKMLETNPAYSEDLTTKAKVGKSAVCTYFKFRPGVLVDTSGDFPDISLAKSGWRTENPLTGAFIAGDWTFKVRLENDTKYSFSVKVAVRLTKSVNPDGSNATLIGVYESPNVLNLPASAGGSVSDSWTVSLPEITMSNEYLFAEYRIHIQVAGTSVSCQCSFACDEDPAVADESITTPTFMPPQVTTLPATDVEATYATLNGETANFTATIRGFDWGKQSGNYTDSWTEEGEFPPGTFSYTITNLDPDTDYYFRAKAYSPATGWLYGSELSFHTLVLPPPRILTEYGELLLDGVDEWGFRKIDRLLEDGRIIMIVVVVVVESIIAKHFPMLYLAKPVKAQELISKVEGATIIDIAKDFPKHLIKKGKANELKSKFTT